MDECLAKKLTFRERSAELGLADSTAFRLRHRFLRAIVARQSKELRGLVEVD